MEKQSEGVFHALQKDLASRSKYGQLKQATNSGHYIQRDRPQVVVNAVRELAGCRDASDGKPHDH